MTAERKIFRIKNLTRRLAAKGSGSLLLLFLIAGFVAWVLESPAAAQITVRAAVEKQEVFVGESFLFQIQVEGSESPQEPDLGGLADFHVTPRGGQKNSSESITIINGRMNRVSKLGYVMNYSLSPKRAGNLLIPAVEIAIGQEKYQTNPISILARKPVETEDFKLRLSLGKESVYVGEPINLEVTWYIGMDVRNFTLNIPLLGDDRFVAIPEAVDVQAGQEENFIRILLGDREIIARKGTGGIDGKNYTTVSFSMTLIARQPGEFMLPQATVACDVLNPNRANRRQDPFGSMFQDEFFGDFFGRRGRDMYQSLIIPSNEPLLTVRPLPEDGKPADFTGLVGNYSVAAQADPLDVNVGDPVTLTVMVTGPTYLENVSLPSLSGMPGFDESFKIPEEMAPGVIEGRAKVFTQTLRAKHAGVAEIPQLLLGYFNTESGRYETARTSAIPIRVKETREVTAEDAEGRSGGALQHSPTDLASGIAHNYEDLAVLEAQKPVHEVWRFTPAWIAFLAGPPLLLVFVVVGGAVRGRLRSDTPEQRSKKAYARMKSALSPMSETIMNSNASPGREGALVFEALRQFLGEKLALKPASLTFADVEEPLRRRQLGEEQLGRLREVFKHCEEFQYGGGKIGDKEVMRNLIEKVLRVAHELDTSI